MAVYINVIARLYEIKSWQSKSICHCEKFRGNPRSLYFCGLLRFTRNDGLALSFTDSKSWFWSLRDLNSLEFKSWQSMFYFCGLLRFTRNDGLVVCGLLAFARNDGVDICNDETSAQHDEILFRF